MTEKTTKTNKRATLKTHRAHCGLLSGLLLLAVGPQARAALADSVADFSGTQGLNNWLYGYYTSNLTSSTFTQMTQFQSGYWAVDPTYSTSYTSLISDGGHPDSAGRGGEAVRRWTSNVSGTVTLSGAVADLDAGGGDGVITDILVDGSLVYSHTIANGASADFNYSFDTTVTVGSQVDFVIDVNGNSLYDSTKFTAVIVAVIVPEPTSAALLLGSGAMLLLRRRRA